MFVKPKLSIAGILLSAGGSHRFGGSKLLQDLEGRPLVAWAASALRKLEVAPRIAVVSPASEARLRAVLEELGYAVREVEEAALGLGHSIAGGLSSLDPASEAALLVLADQPLVSAGLLRDLVECYEASEVKFVASSFAGRVGPPALFDRALFPELCRLQGDQGARGILDDHATDGRVLEFEDWRGADVDTPSDLEKVAVRLRRGQA